MLVCENRKPGKERIEFGEVVMFCLKNPETVSTQIYNNKKKKNENH